MDEAKLKRGLDELITLRKEIFISIASELDESEDQELKNEDDLDINNNPVYKYRRLKAEVLLELTRPYRVPQISDPVLRNELKEFLKDGDIFITNIKRKGIDKKFVRSIERLLRPEFKHDRLDEVAEDLFLDWFNQYDYVYRLLDTVTIVIKNIDLPHKLHDLINEVRQCVVFQRYLAAGIMLRTIAEVAVDDILERNYEPLNDRDLSEKLNFLERKSRFSIPASILDRYRRDLNQFVHGDKTMDREKIDGYLEIVLNQIQELYEESE